MGWVLMAGGLFTLTQVLGLSSQAFTGHAVLQTVFVSLKYLG